MKQPPLRTKVERQFVCLLLLMVLVGCDGPKENQKIQMTSPDAASSRISIERISAFDDPMAYHQTRGIYIIKDSRTGREYLGISGIGISELDNTGGKQNQELEN